MLGSSLGSSPETDSWPKYGHTPNVVRTKWWSDIQPNSWPRSLLSLSLSGVLQRQRPELLQRQRYCKDNGRGDQGLPSSDAEGPSLPKRVAHSSNSRPEVAAASRSTCRIMPHTVFVLPPTVTRRSSSPTHKPNLNRLIRTHE